MSPLVRFASTLWSMVEGARLGNRTAWNTLAERYRPPIVNFASARGLHPDEAEDAAQETLLRLFRTLGSANPAKGKFRSLVLGIARNVIHEVLRRRGTGPLRGEPEDPTPRDESFDRAWMQNIVLLGMESLRSECESRGTPFYRVLRAQMNGASVDEISRELGTGPNRIKSYLHQARQKVRRSAEESIAEYSLETEYEAERDYLLRMLHV